MSDNVVDLDKIRYEKAIQERMKEYAGTHEKGLHNLTKNMKADRSSTNKYFSSQLPVDEMATMGSDTQGIVRDHSKVSPEMKQRWDSQLRDIEVKEQAAKRLLKEKGYEEVIVKPTKKNPTFRTVFKNSATGKVLKGLSAFAILGASDMASAAADLAIPGGVEDMGRDEDQIELDRRYQEIMRRRAK